MREKDEIDFRNQLLPDKDQPQPKKVAKEEDKPWLTSQMMEDLQMLLAVFLIIVVTLLIIILKVGGGDQSSVLLRQFFTLRFIISPPLWTTRPRHSVLWSKIKTQTRNTTGPGSYLAMAFYPVSWTIFAQPTMRRENKARWQSGMGWRDNSPGLTKCHQLVTL